MADCPSADPGFDLLYEEGPCLAVAKPSGVLTQAPPGIDSLEVRIKAFLKRRGGGADNVYLGVPHRLDRPASGAMVNPVFLTALISLRISLFTEATRREGSEMEILCLLAEGQSNKVIARNLGISDGTVKLHVKAILRKLNVHSRVEAAVRAVEENLCQKVE